MSRASSPKQRPADCSVWALAEDRQRQRRGPCCATVLVVGDAGAGKSALLQSFLRPAAAKDPRPTFALDYSFARRKAGPSSAAQGRAGAVAHLWELGGEAGGAAFYDVPVTARNARDASLVLVLDMSRPQNLFASLRRHTDAFKALAARRAGELQSADRAAADAQREYAGRGSTLLTEAEARRVRWLELPLLLVCARWDLFRALGVAERRLAYQTVRLFAHHFGASVCCSSPDPALRETARAFLSAACFQTAKGEATLQTAPERPLVVSAGADSFEGILLGKGDDKGRLALSESEVRRLVGADGATAECWTRVGEAMAAAFGPADASEGEQKEDECPEPEVDEGRRQRDVALAAYVADRERRDALRRKMSVTNEAEERGEGEEEDEGQTRGRGRASGAARK